MLDIAMPPSHTLAMGVKRKAARAGPQRLIPVDEVAKDLHDGPLQLLAGAQMLCDGLAQRERPIDSRTIQHIADQLASANRLIRRMVSEWAEDAHTYPTLGVAVQQLEAEAKRYFDTPFILQTDPVVRAITNPGIIRATGFVLRELLANASKHSQASMVHVLLKVSSGHLWLVVEDDGVGFPPDRHAGHGLRNIVKRAELLNGWCRYRTRPQGGAVVVWVVPTSRGRGLRARSGPRQPKTNTPRLRVAETDT